MAHPATEQQLLGSLIKNPKYILQTDRYSIKSKDFDNPFYKYVFWAVENLAPTATDSLAPHEIEKWLEQSPTAKSIYNEYDGNQLLADMQEAAAGSFDGVYQRFERENLINRLNRENMGADNYYIETPRTDAEFKIMDKFADSNAQDILDDLEMRFLRIKSDYMLRDTAEITTITDGLLEMMEELAETPEVGLPLQGDLFNQAVSGAIKGRLYIRSAASGVGKALPNSTSIPTPNGNRLVGEVRVGDYLYDAFGKPTKVKAIHPQGLQDVYEVVFKDGRRALCNDEHLWSFNTRSQKPHMKKQRRFFTESLREIIDNRELSTSGGWNILVPNHFAVEKEEQEYHINPYTMGLLLGGGSFREHSNNKSLQFSSEDRELPNEIAKSMNWKLKKGSDKNHTWYFGHPNSDSNVWVSDALKDFPELINAHSKDKFIPKEYLNGSIEQRLELLNGLLDSDGSVDKSGRVTYFTNSIKLRDSVVELARSLGYSASHSEDTHKDTSVVWIVRITGRPEDKVKLFKLRRKKKIIISWFNNGKRKEANEYNPIVEINKLDYQEEMTCFEVDNTEHLFLMNDYIVTHNTRSSVGDACQIAFPVKYDWKKGRWINYGYGRKTMIIITEQSRDEIQKMVVAYISGVNEGNIKRGNTTPKEKRIIKQAIQVMMQYQDNLTIVRMPSPTIGLLKQVIREQVKLKEIEYVFYDYIFVSPSLLSEFQGVNLRNDEILLMMSDALKQLAVELNIFVMSSTQVNAKADESKEIRNEASIAGSRAVINKADIGCIMARPSKEELSTLKNLTDGIGVVPNVVTDIYKNRGAEETQIRIWSYVDLGTMVREDLFVTNSRLEKVHTDYFNYDFAVEVEGLQEFLKELNGGAK